MAVAAIVGGVLLSAGGGPWARSIPAVPAEQRNGTVFHMVPKARQLSSYEFTGRFEIVTQDVGFEAPPDYRDSFSFWAEKMKGQGKIELVQLLTMTREPKDDGSIPFRRQVPRYQVELVRPGEMPSTPGAALTKDVKSLVWEGSLDKLGNVVSMKLVAGDETPAIQQLKFELLDYLFPYLEGPRELEVGNSFSETRAMPMPTKLSITGLQDIGVLMTRTYRLKEFNEHVALFDVDVSLALDPETPPQAERTTCVIKGFGRGSATFHTRRGYFTEAVQKIRMTIDFEAPLRRLPQQAEDFDPGVGKSHIELAITMKGDQQVTRVFGEDED